MYIKNTTIAIKISQIWTGKLTTLSFVSGENNIETEAAAEDKDYASVIPDKFNFPKDSITTAGEKYKKIFTNTTFSENLASFVTVRALELALLILSLDLSFALGFIRIQKCCNIIMNIF